MSYVCFPEGGESESYKQRCERGENLVSELWSKEVSFTTVMERASLITLLKRVGYEFSGDLSRRPLSGDGIPRRQTACCNLCLLRVTGGMKVNAHRDEAPPYAAMLAAQGDWWRESEG